MPLPVEWGDDDNFKLRQGSREPGSFRVGRNSGAVLTMKSKWDHLVPLLQTGIESAKAQSSGKIKRTLPVAHPLFPWLYLRDIDNGQGVSFLEKIESDPEGYLEAPALEYASKYEWYELQAKFEPRPYAVLDDASITGYTISGYEADGDAFTKTAYHEDWRYVEWQRRPAAEYLTADKGQFKWAANGAPTGGPADNKSAGVGVIRKLLPSAVWVLKWHCVPYSYVLSDLTYFSNYIGHVNQQAIWGFGVGEALLQAVNITDIYSPAFPDFTAYSGYTTISQDKLCDIEFVLLEAPGRTATVAVTPTNLSHVVGGHNLAFHAPSSKWYYVENFRTGSMGSGVPIYPSIPFDLLFQNPDGPA